MGVKKTSSEAPPDLNYYDVNFLYTIFLVLNKVSCEEVNFAYLFFIFTCELRVRSFISLFNVKQVSIVTTNLRWVVSVTSTEHYFVH